MEKSAIIEILREMNIVDEYIALSKKHQIPIKELFKNHDNDRIIEIIQSKGYDVTYNKTENFFKISYPKYNNARFQMNLILKSGMVDIVWCVWWKDQILTGVPMSMLIETLSEKEIPTIRPLFKDYADLDRILKRVFKLADVFIAKVKSHIN